MLSVILLLIGCSGDGAEGEAAADNCDTTPADETAAPEGDSDPPVEQPDTDFLADYPPVVIATVPTAGDQAVDPDLDEIRVTFSKDMQDGNWSWVQISASTFPEVTQDPRYEDDRTNVLGVDLEPDTTYAIWLNYEPYTAFQDTSGNAAVPYLLTFHTAPE